MQRTIGDRVILLILALLVGATLLPTSASAQAHRNKGYRLLQQHGLQLHGLATKDDVFHLDTLMAANYTAVHWIWEANLAHHGPAPGIPWARWVGDENQMPGGAEQPYLQKLVALQLGDEWHLNDPAIRDRAVNWFDSVRDSWPNTIIYMNNFGGQVNDAALGDFITRARPDMLAFDTYPWRSNYQGPGQPPGAPQGGPPTGLYSDLRRYRVHALASDLPLAIYRQTFHAIQDYDSTVYRDPSPAELRLNTSAGLAFGATTFIDFTYNTGASSLFTRPGGDSNPTPLYHEQAQINLRTRNLGKALVHLVGKDDQPDGSQPTMDIMFLRGRTGPTNTDVTPLPIGFVPDNALPNTMSEWVYQRNDPHIAGFAVTNLGTRNDGLRGDAIISWFKPLNPALDDPALADDQLYFMLVNAFTGPEGAASEYRQRIAITMEATAGTHLQYLDPDDGEVKLWALEAISGSARRRLVVELDGGDAMLFKFNPQTPFIHLVPEPASLGLLGIGALALRRPHR